MAYIFIQFGLIAALVFFFVATFSLISGSTLFIAIGLMGVGVAAVTVIVPLIFVVTAKQGMH